MRAERGTEVSGDARCSGGRFGVKLNKQMSATANTPVQRNITEPRHTLLRPVSGMLPKMTSFRCEETGKCAHTQGIKEGRPKCENWQTRVLGWYRFAFSLIFP